MMYLYTHLILTIIGLSSSYIFKVRGIESPKTSNNDYDDPCNSTHTAGYVSNEGNIMIVKPSFYSSNKQNEVTIFKYNIDQNDMSIVIHPNRLGCIKFYDDLLVFDDNTNLPLYRSISIIIYTCKDNVPVLIRVLGLNGYYYISPDPETGKWVNYKVDRLSKFEKTDQNGIITYKLDETDDDTKTINDIISNECSILSEKLREMYKRTDNIVSKDQNLELVVKIKYQ